MATSPNSRMTQKYRLSSGGPRHLYPGQFGKHVFHHAQSWTVACGLCIAEPSRRRQVQCDRECIPPRACLDPLASLNASASFNLLKSEVLKNHGSKLLLSSLIQPEGNASTPGHTEFVVGQTCPDPHATFPVGSCTTCSGVPSLSSKFSGYLSFPSSPAFEQLKYAEAVVAA